MSKLLIGMNGRAGTGKDFIAKNCLQDYFKIALADHFKVDVVRKGNFTFEEVFHTKPKHVRDRLQKIGTEEGRDVYGDLVWITALESWMRIISERNQISKYVITDVRFDNEAEWILSKGGIVIRIDSNRSREGIDDETSKHSSESGISDSLVSFTVTNNVDTDLASLNYQISEILRLSNVY